MNLVAAILYAVSTSSLVAVIFGFLRGGLSHSSAAVSLACGMLVASVAMWPVREPSLARSRPPSEWEWLAIISFVLVSLRVFLWVVFTDGDDIKVLSPNNLGDLSLHLTYIRYLASGVPFWPDNPIFTGGKLTYPIGIDLFQSLFVLLGMDVFRGFVWLGLAGSGLIGAALWRWGRGFALFGFLANGGLAGFAIFHTWQFADFQAELGWKSVTLALFATQRGLLFALPAGLLLLSSWRARFFSAGDDDWRLPRWGEVLLYASLPLFHFHTFLFLSVLLGAWFVCQPTARRGLMWLIGLAFVPATTLVYLITGGLKGSHLLGWKAGWMWDDPAFLEWCRTHWGTDSPHMLGLTFSSLHFEYAPDTERVAGLAFWPLNFGLLLVLAPFLVVVLCRRQRWPQWIVLAAAGIVFLCSLLIFAPWEWDGTTLTIWSQPFLVPSFLAGFLTACTRWLLFPLLVLTLIGLACLPPRNSWPRLVVFPALGIFFICCFVKVAPWEWDNTKLMVWSYLAILPFLWSEILAHWPEWIRAAAVAILFFSGFVSTIGGIDGSHAGYGIATRSELYGVADGLRGIPATERFAGAPTYNHPLLLNGRKMVLGYEGHVVSHGLAWAEFAPKLTALMNGDEGWQDLAAELGARYLFWGPNEEEAYKDSAQPWRQSALLVASGDWGAIYDLLSPPATPAELPEKEE
jgi:hypothetical protein